MVANNELSQGTEDGTLWHSTHDMSLSPTEADMVISLHEGCLGAAPCYYADKRADISLF